MTLNYTVIQWYTLYTLHCRIHYATHHNSDNKCNGVKGQCWK